VLTLSPFTVVNQGEQDIGDNPKTAVCHRGHREHREHRGIIQENHFF
jgi:hypothetical protein